MIVRSLSLKNFRSYKGLKKVNFDTGITMIIGANGSGKSSILEAINFALFHDRNLASNDTATIGNHDVDVTLEFRCDLHDFKVSRGKQGSKTYDYLYEWQDEEWVLQTRGVRETDAAIEELLGIGRDVFKDAVYIRQGEIDRILSENADRKNLVGKILGIDRIEAAWLSMGTKEGIIAEFNNRAIKLGADISQKDTHESEKAEKELSIAADRQTLSQLQEERGKNLSEKDDKQKFLGEFEAKEKSCITLTAEKKSSNEQKADREKFLGELNNSLGKITVAEGRNAEIEPDVKNLVPLGQLKDVIVEIDRSQAELKTVDEALENIAGWKDTIKICKDDHDSYERLETDKKVFEEYRPKINRPSKRLATHNQHIEEIAECKAGMEKHDSSHTEYEAIQGKLKLLNKRKMNVSDLIGDINLLQTKLNNMEKWRSDVEKCSGDYERFESLAASIKMASEQKASISGAFKDIKSCDDALAEIKKYRGELEESKPAHVSYLGVKGRIGELEEMGRGVKGSDVRYRDLEKSLGTMREGRGALEKRVTKTVEKYCRVLKIDVCEPTQVREQANVILEEKNARLQWLTVEIDGLNATVNELKGNRKSLMKSKDSISKVEGDQCPTCGADLSSDKKEEVIQHYKDEIDAIKGKMAEADKQAEILKAEKESVDVFIEQVRALNIEMLLKDQGDLEKMVQDLTENAAELELLKPKKDALEKIDDEAGQQKKMLEELEPSHLKFVASEKYLADKNEAAILEERSGHILDAFSAIDAINSSVNSATVPRSLDKSAIDEGVKAVLDALSGEQSLVKEGHDTCYIARENLKTLDEGTLNKSKQESHGKLVGEVENINKHLGVDYCIPEWCYQDLMPSIEDRSQRMGARMEELKDSNDEYMRCKKNLAAYDEEDIKKKKSTEEMKINQFLVDLNGRLSDTTIALVWDKEADLPETIDERLKTLIEKISPLMEPHRKYGVAKANLDKSDEVGLVERRNALLCTKNSGLEKRCEIIANLGYEPEDINVEYERLRQLNDEYRQNLGVIKSKTEVLVNIAQASGRIKELLEAIAGLDRMISELGYDPDAHQKAKDDVKSADEKLQQTQTRIGSLNTQIELTGARIEELKKMIAQIEAKEVELENLQDFIDLLTDIRYIIHKDRLQSEIRRRSIPAIEKYANELFQSFNLPYDSLTITDDYSIILHGMMGDYNVNMMSGGEKVAASLALRVGMARALLRGNLEMLILDEPTAHLDDERRRELATVIRNLEQIPQTIVVTHDDEFDQAATTVIRVKKENGISVLEFG